MRRTIWTPIASLIAIAGLARVVAAEEYRHPSAHFALEIPEGWHAMPSESLEQMNVMVAQRFAQANVHYDHGFVPPDEAFDGYPYVLVQNVRANMKGLSYEQLERQLEREMQKSVKKVEGALADLATDLSAGKVLVDRDKKQIIITMEMNAAGVGPVKGLSIGFLNSEGTVFLHCYDLKSRFQRRLPVFQAMARSFTIDPGYEFTPGRAGLFNTGNPIIDGALNMAVIGGIAGAVVGLVVYTVRKFQKKRGVASSDQIV